MYTVSKGPSKIVQKTRRGLSQNVDSVDVTSVRVTNGGTATMKSSKKTSEEGRSKSIQHPVPVFTSSHGSSRKKCYQEKVSPQQLQIVRYVNEKWLSVQKELKENGSSKVTYYQEMESPSLRNFEPFDLESWWGMKLYRNVTQGT